MADAESLFEFDGHWPFDGGVRIGGHDVTNAVTAFNVYAPADGLPVVTMTMVGAGALRLLLGNGAAEVRIPDETRQALVALGWTPPSGS